MKFRLVVAFMLLVGLFPLPLLGGGLEPHTVILMIGDGMGREHIKAGHYYLGGNLAFEDFPYQATVTTWSADSRVTDSAAAATAIATGHKVNNGVISLALPGDGAELETLLEYFKSRGRSTGLVSTTYITHSTPAGFGAHAASRGNIDEIAADYLNQTRPTVLLGGGGNGLSPTLAAAAGYRVVTTREELLSLNPALVDALSGQFGTSHLPYEYDGLGSLPHLHEMAAAALEVLERDTDGFFLMIEGGRIDHAAHNNDINRCVLEVVEFHRTVQSVWERVRNRANVLLIVTADHETGGLTVTDRGVGIMPDAVWSTTNHTDTPVALYAWGYGAEGFFEELDNTDLFGLITQAGRVYNQPPRVSAGTDEVVLLGEVVKLRGTVVDDEIAQPAGKLDVTWSQLSGPAAAAFAAVSSLETSVGLPKVGVYVLRLTADDGLAQGSADMTVTVQTPNACGSGRPGTDTDNDGLLDCKVPSVFRRHLERIRFGVIQGKSRGLRRSVEILVSLAGSKPELIRPADPQADLKRLTLLLQVRVQRLLDGKGTGAADRQLRAMQTIQRLERVVYGKSRPSRNILLL